MLCQLQRLQLNERRGWPCVEEERIDKEAVLVCLNTILAFS
jgi:hypothetical protein